MSHTTAHKFTMQNFENDENIWNHIDFDCYYNYKFTTATSQTRTGMHARLTFLFSRPSIHKRLNIPKLTGRKERRVTGTNDEATHSDLKATPSGGTRTNIFWKYRYLSIFPSLSDPTT